MANKTPIGPKAIQLGTTIRRLREKRGWDVRRVANATSSSIDLVNDWEAGRDIPTFAQWSSLKGAVNHHLGDFTVLYQEARNEQGFATKPEERKTGLTVSLGEKLAPVISTIKPEPEKPAEGPARSVTTVSYKYPDGAKTTKARNERTEWARAQLKLRPHMPIQGPDGLKTLMRHRFGVALTYDTLAELKREATGQVVTETEIVETEQPSVTVTKPAKVADLGDTFTAATQMVLDAVPNLASFTITVDPATGEAAVAYTIRQVQVVEQSGSIKVGGRK